ncbi:MAG: hypothetical protein H0U15_05000, partial [Geodermatophilaceae bacterium]|nr:hypothetical protein [Geodermatophilaceae bacterium]
MKGRTRHRSLASATARWVLILLVLLVLWPLLVIGLAGPASAAPVKGAGPVVLVGVPGLTWADVSQQGTPALWSLLDEGAVGTLAARSVG